MDKATMKAVAIVVKHVEELGLDAGNAIEIIREIVRDKFTDEESCPCFYGGSCPTDYKHKKGE